MRMYRQLLCKYRIQISIPVGHATYRSLLTIKDIQLNSKSRYVMSHIKNHILIYLCESLKTMKFELYF